MRDTQPLHIKNALIWNSEESVERDLYTANGRIINQPANGALVVDLGGYTLFPGLINAHDHLELNHYPRTKFREVYDNAHQWGEDVNARLDTEPYKSLRAYPLWDRLFIGGLKNLLCGATTVAHHGPPHKPMFRADFPVRVLKNYGWAHSLHFNTDEEIVHSYRSTPKDWLWFIHLAEGTDEIAAGEYKRLKALGCVGANTVIVHGVGMTEEDIADARLHARGLVWCPTTNMYLLGKTLDKTLWGKQIIIGSDSRLTAEGDWLDELRGSIYFGGSDHIDLFHFMTQPAVLLNLPSVGRLETGYYVDWYIQGSFPVRDNVRLVVRDGIPRIGHPDIMAKFPHVQTVAATLDGVEKRIHIDLARQVHHCQLKEPGLEVDALPKRQFYLF